MISKDDFYKIFEDNSVKIHKKAQEYIDKKYIPKGSNLLPFKDVISRLTIDLTKERPLENPWIIRGSRIVRRTEGGNDVLSIASSYLKTSVLSSKSKRMNIDKIIEEHSQVMDRVKGIDDKLKEIGGDNVTEAKEEMLQRAINNPAPETEKLEVVKEDIEKKESEIEKIKPTEPIRGEIVEELKKGSPEEINLLQKLLNDPDTLNEIIRLSQMMIEAKIDFRILEFVKRGVNKEYDDKTSEISITSFHKYWKNLIKPEVDDLDPAIEDKILHFITTKDGKNIKKSKLFTLIDFYQYYPVYVQKEKNVSKEVYYCLSSNTQGTYGSKAPQSVPTELSHLLGYINDKLREANPYIAKTFRYFDDQHKSQINKEEFTKGLEKLKIVMEPREVDLVFNYLDTDKTGVVNYNQF